jgi:uncharacterized delta-60 repeat protein/uncharacterized repeat protein (TIGR01451 family)
MKAFRRLSACLLVIVVALLALWVARHQADRRAESGAPAPVVTTASHSPAPTVPRSSPSTISKPAVPSAAPATAPSLSRFQAFNRWAESFAGGVAPEKRAIMIEQGIRLADERLAVMKRLIQTDPEAALAEALPYRVRKQLPPEIASRVEEAVSGSADFQVLYSTPIPGRESEVPPTEYVATINHSAYKVFPHGWRLSEASQNGVYLHGIAITEPPKVTATSFAPVGEEVQPVRYFAPSAEPGRYVSRDEAMDLAASGKLPIKEEATCGVSRKPVDVVNSQALVQFHGRYYPFCDIAHAVSFNKQLKSMHQHLSASGASFTPAAGNTDNLPPVPYSQTQGIKKLLYMPVLYADDPRVPQTFDQAQATLKANNQYFFEGSYGTVHWESTVTPPIRLPQRANYYGENVAAVRTDARVVAATMGYFWQDYREDYVLFNSLPQVGFGGRSDGLLNASPGAITHELGHNFGLPHAQFWDVTTSPGPVQPTNGPPHPIDADSLVGRYDINAPFLTEGDNGPVEDYGNPYDVMGSGPGHFGVMYKNRMNWLPDVFVKNVTASTTNRIYAFDTPKIFDGRFYALFIYKDILRNYWVNYRQGNPDNPWLSNGLEVGYEYNGVCALLDMTPASTYYKDDAALLIGRTMNDPAAQIFVTPVAGGGGPDPWDKWIDVVVQVGPFPGNQAPTVTLQASATSITNGGTVSFTASGQDPDGDPVAYSWDFGDHTFGLNQTAVSKTFTTNGNFVVRCEVTDMKGGVGSSFVVITVGEPATFTISGRVLDIYGNPVQGVRVHNSGMRPPTPPRAPDGVQTNSSITEIGTYRYNFTDSQGYYVIGNVPAGTFTNRAFLYGYRIDPQNFTDPLIISDGNANNLDFVATPITKVTVSPSANAEETNGVPGVFTFTREGSLDEELSVRYFLSGSAQIGIDYDYPTGNLFCVTVITTNAMDMLETNVMCENIDIGQITIPAGSASVDLLINPISTVDGVGAKTVVATVLLQTNFFRISQVLTNVLITNSTVMPPVVVTNSIFVSVTNEFRVPGWELRPVGLDNTLTWFQTDPTYVLSGDEATLRIEGYDTPNPQPNVGILSLDGDAIETRGDSATVAFFRFNAPNESELAIRYSVSGVASNGVDYLSLPGVITIPAGQDFALLPIYAINDLFVEGNEPATITIEPDPAYISGFFSVANILIVDDDLPQVSVYASDSTAGSDGSTGRITVKRSGDATDDLLVNYLVTGTAVSGTDFTTLAGSVTILAGQFTADVVITPVVKTNAVGSKTVTILLSDSPSYNIYNQNSATVTIVQSSLPTVTLTVITATASEGGGAGKFRFTRTGPTTNSLLVSFEVGGSAWEGADYAAIGTNVLIPIGAAFAELDITPIQDNFFERGAVSGDDTVILGLLPSTSYLVGNPRSGRVTIGEDDVGKLPGVGFMLRNSIVREDDGTVTLWLKVSANPATNRPIVVEYRVTAPSSAVPNVNYTPIMGVTGFLSFTHFFPPDPKPQFSDPEDGLRSISIPILNDMVAGGNKTLTLTLSDPRRFTTNVLMNTNTLPPTMFTNIAAIPTNAFLSDSRTHTITIVDVGATAVSISALTPLAYEFGPQNGQLRVTRTGPTNAELAVSFTVGGTASSGNDYVALGTNGVITIPAGTNSVLVNVIPLDDPEEEVAESLIVTLLERPGYTVAVDTASMILVSDDGTLQFSSASYQVDENAGPAVITVLRTGGTNVATTVDYRILAGTAASGSDYLGTNGTLSFAPGETLKTFSISVNDTVVEPAETVLLFLTNAAGGVPLGGQRSATLFIENDDTAFSFATNLFRFPENSGVAGIVINRLGRTNDAADVFFATTNASARAPLDFTDTRLTVNFAPGQTSASINVPIADDFEAETNETVTLVLSSPSTNTTVGSISNAVLLIADDECAITFTVGNVDVYEYAGFVPITVRRTGGSVNEVSVGYATHDGTASNAVDYTEMAGTLTFAGESFMLDTNGSGSLAFVPGETNLTILVPILDDVLGEGNEYFTLNLSNATGTIIGSVTLGLLTNATVTILDNETPGNPDYEYNPGSGANARVRSLGFQQDQRVVFGGDFTLVNGISLNRVARLTTTGVVDPSFNPGAGANNPVYVVTMQPDDKILVGGAFTTLDGAARIRVARLSADGNLDLSFNSGSGPNNTVRAVAVQADGKILIAGDFTSVNGTNRAYVARLNPTGGLDTTFNANVNGTVQALAVQSDGAVLLGGAFTSVGGATRSRIARVQASGALDATFNPGAGANNAVYSLALQADGKVLVGGAFTTIHESAANFLARLNADGSADAGFTPGQGPNAAVNSVYVAANGKIAIGGDFTLFNGISRNYFARLRSNGTLDTLFNIGSGANLPVQTTAIQSNSAVMIGGDFTLVNNVARGRIARIHGDERSNLPSVEFSAPTYTVVEGNTNLTITVVRSGATNSSFVIDYVVTAGTATETADYNGAGGSLGFAAGETTKTFSIQILDDPEFELNETVLLTLVNAHLGVDTNGLIGSTLVIVDDEKGLQFSASSYSVAEEGTNAVVTVTRSGQLSGTATVVFQTDGGTATPGVDYVATNLTLTFTDGEASKNISIRILDDSFGEADETIFLTLSNAVGAVTNTPFIATLYITNVDQTFGTFTSTSTNRITILDGQPASPYPSAINVTGLTGVVSRVALTLLGLTHTFPGDIDALLVGPAGQAVLFMSDAGGTFDLTNVVLRFEDGVLASLPQNAQILGGTNKPTNFDTPDPFTVPAPGAPYASAFSAFANTSPNGVWSLYIMDDRGSDVGVISNGWSLEITTVDPNLITDLGISMTGAPASLTAGQTLTYTMLVTNAGPLASASVRVTNALPANTEFLSATSSQGGCTNAAGTVICSLGAMAVNDSAQITLSIRPLTAGTLTNMAIVGSTLADVTPGNDIAITTTTVNAAAVADLVIAMTDAPDPVLGGSNITYTISVTNFGPLAATTTVVTNYLPSTLAFVSASSSVGSCNNASNQVTCNLGTLAPGARATVTVTARTLASGQLQNKVGAYSSVADFTPAMATATTTVQNSSDLFVYQIESEDPIPFGATLTYTVVVTNRGVSTASAVSVFDTLPSGTTFLSVFASQGSCANIGSLVICSLGSLTNGGAATVTIDVQPDTLSPLINSVNVSATEFDPNSTNNFSTEITTVFVTATKSLFITPSTDANALAAAVTGQGQTGIQVTGVNLQAHQNEFGTSSGLFTIGAPPYTYNLTRPGIVLSTGDVKDYESGPNTFSSMSTSFGIPSTPAQEALLDPITGAGGQNFRHNDVTQLDIQFNMQQGFDRIEFKVVFGSEEYPIFVGSSFIDGFGIYLNGSNIAFSAAQPINIDHPDMRPLAGTELNGVLAPGGNPVMTFSAPVTPGSSGNTLSFILGDTTDTALDTTVYVSSLQGGIGANADLAVQATVTPEPVRLDSNLVYTVTIQNRGPDDAPNTVVTDTLPSQMTFVSAAPSQGSCSFTNGELTCALGQINRSASATITLTVGLTASGRVTNSFSVFSDLLDLRPNNNTARVVSTVVDPGAFASLDSIFLLDAQPALPYPASINVSGLGGTVSRVTVTLVELSHSFPGDLDIALVGPGGQRVMLMSDAGGGFDANGLTLRFDDNAAITLPQSTQISSGDYRPTDYEAGDQFSSPGPTAPFATAMSVFNGTNPNGTWSLWITDDRGVDSGVISAGWRLNIETIGGSTPPALTVGASGGNFVISWPILANGYTLYSTTTLGPGAVWTLVGTSPVQGGGLNTVTVPLSGAGQFFRLQGP